jgi:hypothetical protein
LAHDLLAGNRTLAESLTCRIELGLAPGAEKNVGASVDTSFGDRFAKSLAAACDYNTPAPQCHARFPM